MTIITSDSVFTDGMDAFYSGQPKEANPYESGSLEETQWIAGWEEAENEGKDE